MRRVDCLLIRHAESQPDPAVPQDDWPLSAVGRAQAEALAAQLVDHRITRLYASPYPRAVATVRPLADVLGLEIEIHADLRERRLAAGEVANWREELEKTWRDFDYAPPGGETSRACQHRVRACVSDVLRATDASRVAICSHGNAIALLLNSLDPSFGFADWAAMANPHLYRLVWDGDDLRMV